MPDLVRSVERRLREEPWKDFWIPPFLRRFYVGSPVAVLYV